MSSDISISQATFAGRGILSRGGGIKQVKLMRGSRNAPAAT